MAAQAQSSLPWQWILEHLLHIKDVGPPILKEMMTYIPDVEKYNGLQKKIALRYLEEIIALGEIDAKAILLVVALMGDPRNREAQKKSVFSTGSIDSDLLLRVQTEAVLTHVRKKPKNWEGFLQAVDRIFPEESDDARLVERRKQLIDLLLARDREKACLKIMESFSLDALRHDLFKYIALEKARLEHSFINQLLHDVFEGKYSLSEGFVGERFLEKEGSKADLHMRDVQITSIGSDEQATVVVDQQVHKDLDGCIAMGQDGKVATSHQQEDSNLRSLAKDEQNNRIETVTLDTEDDSLCVELLDLGSDGHEEMCHKCRKPGTLICCDGCPIAVHAKCVGSNSTIISENDWYCPVCMQKKAAEAVARAQQEERDARQRLANFIASARGKKDHRRSSHNSSVFSHKKLKTDCGKKDSVDYNEGPAETSLEKPSSAEVHIPEANEAMKATSFEKGEELGRGNEDGRESKDIHTKLQTGPVIETKMDPLHVDQVQVQGEDGDGHDGDLEEGSDGSKIDDGYPTEGKFSRRKQDTDEDSHVRACSQRILRKEKGAAKRRKRHPWSKVEEDTLKEGVQKFSHNGAWGFQWTRILAFGKGKFHKSRTDVDLKDKWRNLSKIRASPS